MNYECTNCHTLINMELDVHHGAEMNPQLCLPCFLDSIAPKCRLCSSKLADGEKDFCANCLETRKSEIFRCENCGELLLESELHCVSAKTFCETCYEELTTICEHCERPMLKEYAIDHIDGYYCEDCYDELFVACSDCGKVILREGASRYNNQYYCLDCFDRSFGYCDHCGYAFPINDLCSDDNGQSYCSDCRPLTDELESSTTNNTVEILDSTTKKGFAQRKFGVEIECYYDEHTIDEENWLKVNDGSLDDKGVEYVSPILQGQTGYDNIKAMCKKLNDSDHAVNTTCGLHVHIDGRDLSAGAIKRFLKIMKRYEPVLYSVVAPSRHNNSNCRRMELSWPELERIKNKRNLKSIWYRESNIGNDRNKYHSSRYHGINLHSLFYRGSIEFRYHHGTINGEKITNYIQICQKLVEHAKKSYHTKKSFLLQKVKENKPKSIRQLTEELITGLKLNEELSAYIKARQIELNESILDEIMV